MDQLLFTREEECIGCNKCLLGCPVEDANTSYIVGEKNKIHVHPERCILCGKCMDVCDHDAREFHDDSALFFDALRANEKITLVVAPAFKTNFPHYKKILGYLKSCGVEMMYDVSFGADITTWAYLKSIEEKKLSTVIAQPCPAVVSYIEKYHHELIPLLAPVHSPVISLATYLKKYRKESNRIAFLSPCIAKGVEIHDDNTFGRVQWNVTFKKLIEHAESSGISFEDYPEVEMELPPHAMGDIYSSPGGLKENVYLYNPEAWVAQVEGPRTAYHYLKECASRNADGKKLPFLIDILNCRHGCNIGSGTCKDVDATEIDGITNELRNRDRANRRERLDLIRTAFDRELKLEDFVRSYSPSFPPMEQIPTDEEYSAIFESLFKYSEESRGRNCNACGYGSCHHMALAIFNNYNHKENCVDYNAKVSADRMVLEKENQEINSLLSVVQKKSSELEDMNFKLQELDKVKSDFISTVSHELRTPLTSVLGFAKIIKKKLDDTIFPLVSVEEKKVARTIVQISDNIQIVLSEGERLTNLINDVLDIAKMEAGKVEWKKDSVTIGAVIDHAVAATSSLFVHKTIRLKKEIEPDLPTIIADNDRLIQVVINLISNAVKFTDEGEITCRAFLRNGSIQVSIIDTGIGIAKEDHEIVFEKFRQVGDTLTDKPKGTGLGLPICSQIIRHHGGKIWVESELGVGSTFSFLVPATPAKDTEARFLQPLKDKVSFALPIFRKNETTILLVDDDESIRLLLRQEFEEEGYIVEEAENGIKAVEMVKSSKPDAIILDIMMPVLNGFDVAAIIRNDPKTKNIPIVVVSIVEDRERGFGIGVDRYFSKPIDTGHLLKEVAAILMNRDHPKKVVLLQQENYPLMCDHEMTLIERLQINGFLVSLTTDGNDCLTSIQTFKPDMVIICEDHHDRPELLNTLRTCKEYEDVVAMVYSDQFSLCE